MSAKAGIPCALVWAILGIGMAQAEDPPSPVAGADTPLTNALAQDKAAPVESLPPPEGVQPHAPPSATGETPAEPAAAANPPAQSGPTGLSSWIQYYRPDCCGPVGGNGSIHYELYTYTGPTIPVGNQYYGHTLDTGWGVQAGGRSLFFDTDESAAWTVDLGLSYYYNHCKPGNSVTFDVPSGPVTAAPRDLGRTYGSLAVGRVWYLNAPATDCGMRWRIGCDFDGRLGTAREDFVETTHRTNTLYGIAIGGYTDLEFPNSCCTWLVGLRAEWAYTWVNDNLGIAPGDIQDVNLWLTFGVRF
jgi:hypothetical protein